MLYSIGRGMIMSLYGSCFNIVSLKAPEEWMQRETSYFPFGKQPIFRAVLVNFREGYELQKEVIRYDKLV